MKPPTLLRDRIPANIIKYVNETNRRIQAISRKNEVAHQDVELVACVEGILKGKTIIVPNTQAWPIMERAHPRSITPPFVDTVFQFTPYLEVNPRIRQVCPELGAVLANRPNRKDDSPLAAIVILHRAADDKPVALPPPIATNIGKQTLQMPEAYLIYLIRAPWTMTGYHYRPDGRLLIAPEKVLAMQSDEYDMATQAWRMAANLCNYVTEPHRVELQPLSHKHLAITPKEQKKRPSAYYVCIIKPTPITPPDQPPQPPSPPSGRHIEVEFDVRPHLRTYKSGKQVWIAKYVKGKGYPRKETIYQLDPAGPHAPPP